jgi:hypothetical protein
MSTFIELLRQHHQALDNSNSRLNYFKNKINWLRVVEKATFRAKMS